VHNGQGVESPPPVAQLILRARIAAGLSRQDLGEQIGVSRFTIYRWEDRGFLPHPRYVTALTIALKIQVAEFEAAYQSERATFLTTRGRTAPPEEGLGFRLRHVRFQLSLTQRELGLQLGVSQSSVSAWELGSRAPGKAQLSKINKFLEENQ